MLLIGQLVWIVTPGKEEKLNTYMYYKRAKEQSTSVNYYHQIIFFRFCSETNTDQQNFLFCVIQSYKSNNFVSNWFINDRYYGFFSIASLIDIVNPGPIEGYMNGVPITIFNEQ